MTKARRTIALAVSAVTLLIVSGCASTEPSRFYTLSSLKAQEPSRSKPAAESSSFLFVGPIHLPDYLERPQLVTRTGANEIQIAEFSRWAGSLRADVTRVLVEDLALLLSAAPVTVLPWRAVTTASPAPDAAPHYKVVIEVTRFDGALAGSVVLDATWGLVDRDWKDLLSRRRTEYREPVSGKDYAALVDAMSRALGRLSRDVADSVAPRLAVPPLKEAAATPPR